VLPNPNASQEIIKLASSKNRALRKVIDLTVLHRGFRRNPTSRREIMTQIQATSEEIKSGPVGRLLALAYGFVSYTIFLGSFLYAIGFVSGLVVPKTIDSGPVVPMPQALIVDLVLMSVFAIQHSVMARRQFKQWWTQFVPKPVERSTYVLFASLALVLLFWQWRPIPAVVWEITDPGIAKAILGLSLIGWLLVLTSTFLINHFELFGLHQVANNLIGRPMPAQRFRTPLFYKFVRHPIYLGFIIAFWAAATMTTGHLLFAAVTTAYIFVGILLEEHDMVDLFGEDYRRYKDRVSMLLPWRKSMP
jgi:methanethiol S-methyltransferase